ncbi:hypothetical protein Tco_1154344 [Tanacetum coccineum]
MIGSLMYLTASSQTSHLLFVLVQDSPFDLEAFFDSDYARASLDRKSTTGGCQFLGKRLMIAMDWRYFLDAIEVNSGISRVSTARITTVSLSHVNHSSFHHISTQTQHHKTTKVRVTKISQSSGPTDIVADETVHKKWEDIMERDTTTASSFEAEQDSGYEQIVDFLNANRIKYALTVNPTLYSLCIKQFWTSAKVKTVTEDVRIQALVDGKKVIVNEASSRRDLRLDDVEGTACLPNDTIFEELARMGYEKPSQKLTFYKAFFSPQGKFLIHTILQCLSVKTTAWNEFSSTMASAIICLANN